MFPGAPIGSAKGARSYRPRTSNRREFTHRRGWEAGRLPQRHSVDERRDSLRAIPVVDRHHRDFGRRIMEHHRRLAIGTDAVLVAVVRLEIVRRRMIAEPLLLPEPGLSAVLKRLRAQCRRILQGPLLLDFRKRGLIAIRGEIAAREGAYTV